MSDGFFIEGLDELLTALDDAVSDADLKKEFEEWLDALGFQFLEEVQNEIIRTGTVDERRLLNSFDKGDGENVWMMNSGSLTLEVGTNVEYATYVNDGHFTVDINSGKDRRWVPGYWQGDRFIYDKGAKTGMLLKVKWIDGTNYFDNAQKIFEAMFDKSLENLLEDWMSRIGGA